MFDHDCPLEHGPDANLLAVDHGIEAAADLVIEGWDDGGQRNEINDLAHVVASLWLAVTSRMNKKGPNYRQQPILPEAHLTALRRRLY
jgi:hypothetical protein